MRGGHAHRRGHALLVLVVAHMSDGELVGDQGDDAGADRFPHQVQHHVQRRGAARARDAVAVDHEQVLRQAAFGEFTLQHCQVFPVRRATVAVEQPGTQQRAGARAQTAQRHIARGQVLQPLQRGAVEVGVCARAAANEHGVGRIGIVRHAGVYGQPVAGRDRPG
ncbi:hypothetical protein D3C72_1879810 [compost metagenome]